MFKPWTMRVWRVQLAILTHPLSESAKLVFQNNIIFPVVQHNRHLSLCVLWKQCVRWLSSSSTDAQPLMWSENVTNWPIIKQYICSNVTLPQVPPDKPGPFPALCHTDGFHHNIIIKNIAFRSSFDPQQCQSFQTTVVSPMTRAYLR